MAGSTKDGIRNNQGLLNPFVVVVQSLNMGQRLDMFAANSPAAKAAVGVRRAITMPAIHIFLLGSPFRCSALSGASQTNHAPAHFLLEHTAGVKLRDDQPVEI